MSVAKEFIVLMEDRPSTLGKVCRALADREVNILALQSFPIGGKSVTRFIVDNPSTAKTVLDSEQLTYVEAEIVQAKLPHRPGEIARMASRLGEANININYAYCGLEPGTNTALVFFGVAEVSKAAPRAGRCCCCEALDLGELANVSQGAGLTRSLHLGEAMPQQKMKRAFSR